jgi:putative ABC transport system ATP-binding protein
MNEPVLVARGVTKVFELGRQEVRALRGVDLEVRGGEFMALVGPSGSGKTTLLNLVGALDVPTSGELVVLGRQIAALSRRERADLRLRSLGFVFQAFNLVPTLTAQENVALAAEYAGASRPAARRAAGEVLAALGLAERTGHRPLELSGGEQQRVALARALVNEPQLIFGDEPTGNLDSARTAEVLALLRRINRERGQTMLIVTHDPDVGAACDRVIRMRDGRIVADEPAVQVRAAA